MGISNERSQHNGGTYMHTKAQYCEFSEYLGEQNKTKNQSREDGD
jgi:hypothetical protein